MIYLILSNLAIRFQALCQVDNQQNTSHSVHTKSTISYLRLDVN